VNKSVWEETVGENADQKNMRSCDRCEGRVHTTEGEGIPFVKRGGERIHKGTVEEGLYQAIKVTANGTGVLCREERWQKEDSTKL